MKITRNTNVDMYKSRTILLFRFQHKAKNGRITAGRESGGLLLVPPGCPQTVRPTLPRPCARPSQTVRPTLTRPRARPPRLCARPSPDRAPVPPQTVRPTLPRLHLQHHATTSAPLRATHPANQGFTRSP